MSELIPALEFGLQQQGLKPFVDYLHKLRFPHRLSEHDGQLVLWVYQPEHVALVRELYLRFQQGTLPEVIQPDVVKTPSRAQIIHRMPVTLVMMLLACAGFLLVQSGSASLLSWVTFQPFAVTQGQLQLVPAAEAVSQLLHGQLWRLVTPDFLHFDWMHLGFNLTFFWYFARQIEQRESSLQLLSHVLLLSIASNVLQFYVSSNTLFGGLSGVNYGLMAYCWLGNRLGKPVFLFPEGLFWVSVVMMLLGFAGFFSVFGYGIANWAHLGGLLAGLLLALVRKI